MTLSRTLGKVGKEILEHILNMTGPSVDNPYVRKNAYGGVVKAGNLSVHLFQGKKDPGFKEHLSFSRRAEYLGIPGFNFLSRNCYQVKNHKKQTESFGWVALTKIPAYNQ